MMQRMNVGHSGNKKALLDELLGLGMVLVALDARIEGVDVPAHLHGDPQLRLNLSYRFGLPMAMDPWGISATLTFGGVPHACRFPWASIFLMVSHVNGEPYLFPDDVPSELLYRSDGPQPFSLRDAILPTAAARPRLSVIAGGEQVELPSRKRGRRQASRAPTNEMDPADGSATAKPPGPVTPPRASARSRNHLRVVK